MGVLNFRLIPTYALKQIEEKVGKNLKHMGTGEIFQNGTSIAYAQRSIIDKWDLIKSQIFCKAQDAVNRTKWQPTDGDETFANPTFYRGRISNIYKELKQLDS